MNCELWPSWFPFVHKPGEVTAYFSTNAKLDVIRCVRCGCVLATFICTREQLHQPHLVYAGTAIEHRCPGLAPKAQEECKFHPVAGGANGEGCNFGAMHNDHADWVKNREDSCNSFREAFNAGWLVRDARKLKRPRMG